MCKCHSLGLNSPHGFQRASDIIEFEETESKKLKKLKNEYWSHIKTNFMDFNSVRKLPPSTIQKIATQWQNLDEKSGVKHNFSNVQCLNCHDKHLEHPFSTSEVTLSSNQKLKKMKAKCLTCHDPDQSPEWYKDGKPSEVKVIEMMKKVQCNK